MEQTLYPTADGSYKQISYPTGSHYDTTVGMDSGSWQTDTYVMQIPTRAGRITNVRVYVRCQVRPTQNHDERGRTAIYIYGKASPAYGSENFLQGSVWNDYYTDYALNPWTGVAWTWDDIDELQAGPSLIAYSSSYSYAEALAPYTKLVITSAAISGCQTRVIGMML